MAKIEFEFEHGLPFGSGKEKEMQYDVVLREITTGDIIDARSDAEKVIFVPDETGQKPVTVVSEVMMGLELLRRQVKSVGEIQGPLSLKQLRQLHRDDFELLNQQAEMLDRVLEGAASRGRMDEPSSSH